MKVLIKLQEWWAIKQARLRFLRLSVKRKYLTAENLIMAIMLVVTLAWLSGSMSAMTRNWELGSRLENRKRTLALLKLEVETLELENQYYRSKEYQELAARRQQDKIFPGEKLVILPPNTLLAKNKFQDKVIETETEPSNFEQWMMFLMGGKK